MKDLFKKLPAIGSSIGDSVVIQVNDYKYKEAIQEGDLACSAINRVLKEFNDLGVGSLSGGDLPSVVSIDSVNTARKFVTDFLLKQEGEIKIGNLKINPSFIASALQISEVEEFVAACKYAHQCLYAARSNWKVYDFEVIDGSAQPKQSSLDGVFSRCIVKTSNKDAKAIFGYAQQLVGIQNELNRKFPSSYAIGLDHFIKKDTTGDIVPEAFVILKRAGVDI